MMQFLFSEVVLKLHAFLKKDSLASIFLHILRHFLKQPLYKLLVDTAFVSKT